jgi:hypothetical protein
VDRLARSRRTPVSHTWAFPGYARNVGRRSVAQVVGPNGRGRVGQGDRGSGAAVGPRRVARPVARAEYHHEP